MRWATASASGSPTFSTLSKRNFSNSARRYAGVSAGGRSEASRLLRFVAGTAVPFSAGVCDLRGSVFAAMALARRHIFPFSLRPGCIAFSASPRSQVFILPLLPFPIQSAFPLPAMARLCPNILKTCEIHETHEKFFCVGGIADADAGDRQKH